MRKWIVIASLLVAAVTTRFAVAADAEPGPLNPRFDGKWIGVETFVHQNALESWAGKTPQVKAILVISDSGKTVASSPDSLPAAISSHRNRKGIQFCSIHS